VKLIQTGLALAVLAILPQAADAGLMYTFQISGTVYPVPSNPSPGQIDIPSSSGTVSMSGCGVGSAPSRESNFQTAIGTVSLSNWSTAMPNASGINPLAEFGVVVTITDLASGQSAQVTAYGEAFSAWKQQPNGSWAFPVAGIGVTYPGSVTLGTNLYRVGIEPAFSSPDSTAPVIANVDVSVTSLAAPEPGTIALVASGLPLVGFFFRRRATSRS
jgi:hypothetical protein